ncbi:MAG: MBL fold metallo-hydrolase [Marinilabiliales bacterium]|nr:MAG: MBL fold metallo-hydrolase [Marinilabiliales bacterium]
MKALEIKKGIYWVGAIDWNVRNFHGYLTQRGTTYNAYLIIDEKITLIDTVKAPLVGEMMQRIESVIDPSKIDYVVSNHVEMDHSGAIPMIMEKTPNATVVCSPKGEKGLRAHFKKEWNFKTVGNGELLDIGERKLNFVLTPMVHWPDNMVAYMPDEKILFSNDAFGQHLASSARLDDNYSLGIIMEEARKYYANIVLPYSSQVRKVMEIVDTLDIDIIASSHGIVWKKHVKDIIAEYKKWASNQTEKKAVIVFDSMWKSTESMAFSLYEAFEEKGYKAPIFNLQHNHISDIMTEMITAEYLCIGSPTLNKDVMPSVAAFLTYLRGLAPEGRKAVVFGSYGWAKQNIKVMKDFLTSFDLTAEYNINYIPSDDQLKEMKEDLKSKI